MRECVQKCKLLGFAAATRGVNSGTLGGGTPNTKAFFGAVKVPVIRCWTLGQLISTERILHH